MQFFALLITIHELSWFMNINDVVIVMTLINHLENKKSEKITTLLI